MRFLGRLLWLIITVSAVAIAMTFATANDGIVTLSLWPVATTLSVPLWLAVLGSLGIGLVIGGITVWASALAIRARNWRLRQKLTQMEQRARAAEDKLAAAEAQKNIASSPAAPATPASLPDAPSHF